MLRNYLNKKVKVKIDRSLGSVHPKHKNIIYPINYGYIENTVSGDGEEIDVYVLDKEDPVEEVECKIIAVIERENDCEHKLVGVSNSCTKTFTIEEIKEKTYFQEQYFKSNIILANNKNK